MEATLLFCGSVWPQYHQVELSDPDSPELPEWKTGEEAVVASERGCLVATRPDHIGGEVVIEVWRGLPQDDGEILYEGDLVLAGDEVVVGSTVGSELHRVAVGRGSHRLVVLGDASPPSRIAFVLD